MEVRVRVPVRLGLGLGLVGGPERAAPQQLRGSSRLGLGLPLTLTLTLTLTSAAKGLVTGAATIPSPSTWLGLG